MLYKHILWLKPLLILTACLFFPASADTGNGTKRWVISENSSLCVNGSTNVNTFACDIPSYDQTDTLSVTKNKNNNSVALSGNIALKVQNFDCHNPIMTHDLRATLKEKQFPKLRITFLSLSELPELSNKQQQVTGFVNIELVGISKRVEVNYQVSVNAQKEVLMIGMRDINFSDFNLVPPRKLGGLIRTSDKLSVNFHLKMKALD
jgi:hypothetical protein